MQLTTMTQSSLSLESADAIARAATEYAASVDKRMVVAIVDRAGELQVFRRMDGAPLLSVEIARNKAYTAAAFGISTDQWYDFIAEDPPLRVGIVHTPRLIVFGGGFPIQVDGELVGGIGVSGGHYSEDMEVAQAGLRAVGLAD
ncbi:MAG: hypothetical protein QOI62_1702 [Solirubrobacteraceae bacterium]|nr:hypothetical protein [Solirubrobacteraceae bacterium]MEA2277919.1 hypothetical protein [Solirubrobacteraceae bacterium]MEA2358442.1 hypothetical protein [Solirubrobacteraceae bacterium]MEA2419062.1 hypothetical protein [Thermoleophilaceae bacterium]